MKSLNNYLKSLASFASLSGLAIATTGNAGSVNALPLDSLNLNTIQQLRQVITQSNQPPEVIINSPSRPGSVPPPPSSTAQNRDTRFSCQLVNGEYTVMYSPESQPERSYPWAIPSELGGGWTPQKRCDAITERFEEYRGEGLLELATGTENGYDTICVTTNLDPSDCKLILTVPPGQDPQLTRDLIFDNLLVADDGQQTQGVYTFGDNQSGGDILGEVGQVLSGSGNKKKGKTSPRNINLRPFLDPADGGTGQQLNPSNSAVPKPNNTDRKPALFR
ncbi:COP23 domain-containing protein [Waterburya agarophytonicola K14]|uniref:COP23 domain-containing protein n=2 Tax=Waterburya TaxID=2886915 RepID=A0A964BQG8_9CYAN|nr:COP23 domain-containing protein [Waterburya agarophytonicola]MCC0176030.1 COP23 domain-containing protein [Waterburya agarophytonicola KI4]